MNRFRELVGMLFSDGRLTEEEYLELVRFLWPGSPGEDGAARTGQRNGGLENGGSEIDGSENSGSENSGITEEDRAFLYEKARIRQQENFGNQVYLRGLIEFTNYCRNDCFYCGIRRSNRNCSRYRLTEEEILDCCRKGHALGFRTFVLQGGEDLHYSDDDICRIVSRIRMEHPDCAVTLSIGEKTKETYRRYREAGADRYLLRHETADPVLYSRLHPEELSLENRKRCLYDLKALGFQTGAGMMVQPPYQTEKDLVSDLMFLSELKPEMIGIGPFIPHKDTPFRDKASGSVRLTIDLIAVLRLMFPGGLLPATTALGTLDPLGREKGILAGANVVMPNLSPSKVRGQYLLYDGKICTGDEAAECSRCMELRMERIGYRTVVQRGDAPGFSADEKPPYRLQRT